MSPVDLPDLLLDLLRLAFLLLLPVGVHWLATARRTRGAVAKRPSADASDAPSPRAPDPSVAQSVR